MTFKILLDSSSCVPQPSWLIESQSVGKAGYKYVKIIGGEEEEEDEWSGLMGFVVLQPLEGHRLFMPCPK